MVRTVVAAVLSLLAAVPALPAAQGAGTPAAPSVEPSVESPGRIVRYTAPVGGAVVRRYDPPQTRFGAGHLGVDLATAPGEAVRAAADGVVTFAGVLAGRGVVVLVHPDGVRTEYEPVRAAVRVGISVHRRSLIGHVHGTHGGCAPDRCVHWGARHGETYLDPLSLLGRLGGVHLVPWSPAT